MVDSDTSISKSALHSSLEFPPVTAKHMHATAHVRKSAWTNHVTRIRRDSPLRSRSGRTGPASEFYRRENDHRVGIDIPSTMLPFVRGSLCDIMMISLTVRYHDDAGRQPGPPSPAARGGPPAGQPSDRVQGGRAGPGLA